jgi:hypothetical protein
VPLFTVDPLETVAVKVTGLANADGEPDVVTVVVVAAGPTADVMSSVQPPAIVPLSPPESSTTYRLHTPFGAAPVKVLVSVAEPVEAGSA